MLKAMANLIRPATERRATRHNKSRSPPLPAGGDEFDTSAQKQQPHHTTLSTRRSSKTTPLLSLDDEKPHAKVIHQTPPQPAPPTRTSSRKRPASALADAPADPRPPTKVTVTQPHGELLRITNGVPERLGIEADDVPSDASTPRPNGTTPGLTVPAQGGNNQDKRSLRSQDGGSRLKSDLAIYFSCYDDIIAGVPKPPGMLSTAPVWREANMDTEFLELDTPIYLIDEPLQTPNRPEPPSPETPRKSASPSRSRKAQVPTPSRKASIASIPPAQSSTSYQDLDYSTIAKHLRNDAGEDPLADSVYFTHHRRAERKEKQLRNIEKERAMHEKVQLERLLDGLQGPDWLKVMGITGVTDGERKEWEPKRDFFVKEVEALVDKFRMWKEQEKKLRAEKEAAHAAKEEEDDEDESESGTFPIIAQPDSMAFTGANLPTEPEVKKPNGKRPVSSSPHPTELEPPKPRRPPRPHGFLLPYIPPEPITPFTSFYSKPHLRAAALGKHRHGRNATAFGQSIPDWEEHEFSLPDDFVTPEFLRDNARKRRRQKRESGAQS